MLLEQGKQDRVGSYSNTTSPFCPTCGKPYMYIGDVPQGGWIRGVEPYCTCNTKQTDLIFKYNTWQYCPHCGKELK